MSCNFVLSFSGYKPKSYIRTWSYAGVDPFEDLLIGPAITVARVSFSLL
jgi:hypothetical protein